MFVISGISLRPTARAARATLGLLSGLGLLTGASVAQSETPAAEVQQVVVTATRFPTPLSRLPADVQIITAEQIAESGATSVNEALMRVLGIPGRLDLNGGGDYALDLRGFGERADNNQVIVVDGVRLSEPDMGGTRLAGIPIETVTRIEVLRGSSAVLYGEGATAGAIVVTTTAFSGGPRDDAPSFKGSVQLGRGNMSSNDASGNARWSQGALSVSGAIKNAASDNHRPNAESKAESGEFAVNWREADWSVGLKHVTDRSDARLPGALSYSTFLTDPLATEPIYLNDSGKIDSARTQFHIRATVRDWTLTSEAAVRDKQTSAIYDSSSSRTDAKVRAKDLTIKASRPWHAGGYDLQSSLGLDRRDWERNAEYVFGSFDLKSESSSNATGWFIRQEITLDAETKISGGLRRDFVERISTGSENISTQMNVWDIGLNHRFTKQFSVWARFGSSYRLPTVDELSLKGTSNLKPQTSIDQEGGVRWISQGYRINGRVYRNSLSNEIAFFGGSNVNLDPTLRQGIEADLTIPFTNELQFQPHFSARKAEFRRGLNSGKSVPLVSPQIIGLRVLGAVTDKHLISGGANVTAAQYVDNNNTCRVPAYATFDARYTYRSRELEASFGVANLLDKRYFATAYGCLNGLPASVYPEIGRAVAAKLKVAF
jgi:iron complex outermembrane recepter protein